MLDRYRSVSYELLRPEQVQAARTAMPILYIPAGSIEWHSFHNPLGTDSLKAHAVCCEAALVGGGLVLPPLHLGLVGLAPVPRLKDWGPPGWEGYTLGCHLTQELYQLQVRALVRSAVEAGWKVLVGVTGHDVEPQRHALQRAIEVETYERGADGFAAFEGDGHEPDETIPFGMDHAGAWETSVMMYVCPGSVDLSALQGRVDPASENLSMKDSAGIGGRNPLGAASAELGRRIVERCGQRLADRSRAMLAEMMKT